MVFQQSCKTNFTKQNFPALDIEKRDEILSL